MASRPTLNWAERWNKARLHHSLSTHDLLTRSLSTVGHFAAMRVSLGLSAVCAVLSSSHALGNYLDGRTAGNNTASIGTGTILSNTTATMNCSASWNSWYNASIWNTFNNVRTYTKTYTYHNITASTTVACDGHTRIVGDLTTTATGTNSTLTSAPRPFTNVKPTCEPAAADCSSLWDMYYEFPCTQTKGLSCGPCHIEGGTVSRTLQVCRNSDD